MKAITIWQPWASLKAYGIKEFETRSWATSYRGPIAIHAAALNPFRAIKSVPDNIVNEMRRALKAIGILAQNTDFRVLPLGCVVATADLVECYQVIPNTLKCSNNRYRLNLIKNGGHGIVTYAMLPKEELLFGDFSYGRFAWQFTNIKVLDVPVVASGKQGLWDWEEAS